MVLVRWGYSVSVSFWILNFGLVVVKMVLSSLFFFRFCMSVSSVISASHWLMAAEVMRQSMKSLSVFLSLKAVCRILGSVVAGMVSIVSSWVMAFMPLVALSGLSVPLAMCLAALATSSKRVMSVMAIWCPWVRSFMGASFGSSLIAMPIAGRRYVVSRRSFMFRFSLRVLFCVGGILRG